MDRGQLRKPVLLSALLLLVVSSGVLAHPFPKDNIHDAGYSYLQPRACEQYCGSDNQFCCGAGSSCYTQDGVAMCAGGMGVRTTTWTETNTFTSTVTSQTKDAKPTPVDKSVPCKPQKEGWTACGWICCDYYQECVEDGQCRVKPGFEEPPGTPIVITTDGHVTTLFSAPFRVTGTDTDEPTGTFGAGHDDAEEDDDDGGGLSGGAIAGIVVGTLAGVGLLCFMCFCCVARGIWGAIFGGKKKEKERTREEIYEDRYTRRGASRPSSYYTGRGAHSSWYGSEDGARTEKRKSGAKWLGLAGLAATLLALLNIRRKKKPAERRTPTMYTDSYMYTDSSPSTSPRLVPQSNVRETETNKFTTGSSSSGGGSKHPSRHSRRTGGRSHRSYRTHRTRQTGGRSSRRSSAH